jgi:hypothetical protein
LWSYWAPHKFNNDYGGEFERRPTRYLLQWEFGDEYWSSGGWNRWKLDERSCY